MKKYFYIAIWILVIVIAILYYTFWYRIIGCINIDKYCRFNYLLNWEFPIYDSQYNEKLIAQYKDMEEYLFEKVNKIDYDEHNWEGLNRYYFTMNLLNKWKFINILSNNYKENQNLNKTYVSLLYSFLYLEKNNYSNIEKFKNSNNSDIRKWFIIWICPLTRNNKIIKNTLLDMKKIESDKNNILYIERCLK